EKKAVKFQGEFSKERQKKELCRWGLKCNRLGRGCTFKHPSAETSSFLVSKIDAMTQEIRAYADGNGALQQELLILSEKNNTANQMIDDLKGEIALKDDEIAMLRNKVAQLERQPPVLPARQPIFRASQPNIPFKAAISAETDYKLEQLRLQE